MKIKEYWVQGEDRPTLTMISSEWIQLDMGPNYRLLGKGMLDCVGTEHPTQDRTIIRLKKIGG